MATALLVSQSGCTLIGAGIGWNIPQEHVVTAAELKRREGEPQTAVAVILRRDGAVLRGKLDPAPEGMLSLDTGQSKATIRLDETRELRVQTGNYLPVGLLIGAVIDVTLTVVAVYVLSHSSFGGCTGC